jgi:hypothetical protein
VRDTSVQFVIDDSRTLLPPSVAAIATWLIAGGVLLVLALCLRINSLTLAYSTLHDLTARDILVGGNLLAGAVYLASCLVLRRPMGKRLFYWMLLTGLVCRLIIMGGTPVLSTDYYRFLWDGAVLAQGHNPWRYSPRAVVTHAHADIPPALTAMAHAHANVMRRINHATLPTIYPPVSEFAMALAAKIAPFSATALRAVYLIFDMATALLIALILRRLHRPASWLLIYWWNPVLINAFYNEAHMDVMTLAMVALFALLLVMDRPIPAAAALGLAIGAKFWPIVLAPVLLRPLLAHRKKLAAVTAVLAAVSAVALAPMFLTGAPAFHSLISYGQYWHNNDGVFRLISMFWHWVFPAPAYRVPAMAARATIAIMYLIALVLLNRKAVAGMDAMRISLFSIMFIFLLSPTEFSWYYTWMLPLLAVCPRISLLVWSLTLGLYHAHYFYPWMIWAEHGPVWALLIIELFWPGMANWFLMARKREA